MQSSSEVSSALEASRVIARNLPQRLADPVTSTIRKLFGSTQSDRSKKSGTATRSLVVIGRTGELRRPSLPEGIRIYVVGDIHGQAASLKAVMRKISSHASTRPTRNIVTVFVGDYIDRGLHSKEVIETLITAGELGTIVALRGNHEELMLSSLADNANMKEWCAVGGIQTMFSYGIDVSELMVGRGYDVARAALREAVPKAHLAWLAGLPSRYEQGDYFFCHAGIDPERPLCAQEETDLLWIRQKFTRSEKPYSKIIVHGHSPVGHVDVRHNRINVDTGAFATEVLSCVALESTGLECL